MNRHDADFLAVVMGSSVFWREVWNTKDQVRFCICNLCGEEVTVLHGPTSRRRKIKLQRLCDEHLDRHLSRFPSSLMRFTMAAIGMGASPQLAREQILGFRDSVDAMNFFRSVTPNTQGAPDATNECKTGQPNEEARLHPAGPGGGALRNVPYGGEDVADR